MKIKQLLIAGVVLLAGLTGLAIVPSSMEAADAANCVSVPNPYSGKLYQMQDYFSVSFSRSGNVGTAVIKKKGSKPLCNDQPMVLQSFAMGPNWNGGGDNTQSFLTSLPQTMAYATHFTFGKNETTKTVTVKTPEACYGTQLDLLVGSQELKKIINPHDGEKREVGGKIFQPNGPCPQPKPQPKPEPKPQPKPQPKPEPKPAPIATCRALDNPVVTNRTDVTLKATAHVANGATVKGYVFTIINKNGKTVHTKTVDSTKLSSSIKLKVNTPGTYKAKVVVKTSLGDRPDPECEKPFTIKPAPLATCQSLDTPVITNRTNVALKATATAAHGATVSGYVFTVTDKNGKVVATKPVDSKQLTANTVVKIDKAGTYKAKVIVKTSLGNKEATACEKSFVIKEAPKPGIKLVKQIGATKTTSVKPVEIGKPFVYTITVTNTGNVKLVNAKVEDKSPVAVSLISADKGKIANNVWTYTIPELAVGKTATFKITAKVNKYVAGNHKNTACVDTPTVPGKPDDCDDETVKVKKPGVIVDKKVDNVEHKKVGINTEFTYQIRVKNNGQSDLKNVKVTDKQPAGVKFIKASAGKIDKDVWTHVIPELKVGKYVDFTIKAKVPTYKAGVITNTVCVDAPSVPGNPDDCDDATVEVPKPVEPTIEVCRLEDKKYPVTIKKNDFDKTKHSMDAKDCDEKPVTPEVPTPEVPETPAELPRTGTIDGLMSGLGLGALVTATMAYAASRRQL